MFVFWGVCVNIRCEQLFYFIYFCTEAIRAVDRFHLDSEQSSFSSRIVERAKDSGNARDLAARIAPFLILSLKSHNDCSQSRVYLTKTVMRYSGTFAESFPVRLLT